MRKKSKEYDNIPYTLEEKLEQLEEAGKRTGETDEQKLEKPN